jgi:hypothetical protein
MIKDSINEKLVAGFELLLKEIDQNQIEKEVEEEVRKHPELSKAQIAQQLITAASRKAATTGALAGGFGGPIALLAMAPDIFNLVRQQSRLILAIAFLHGRKPGTPERLKEITATLAISTGAAGARRGIVFLLDKGLGSGIAYKITKKIAGRMMARKLPTLAPIAGGAIGGAVNYLAVRSVGRLALDFYSKNAERAVTA